VRIYSNLKEALNETERELFEMGTKVCPQTMQDKDIKGNKDFETIELQGYAYCITSHGDSILSFQERRGNLTYLDQEFSDRISSQWLNPGKAFFLREQVWNPFLEKNGKFSYTYNERYREQLNQVVEELRNHPDTRQAVITIYDRHQDMQSMGGIRRIPCSMHYQFLRRRRNSQEYLDVIYVMRSCDFYEHFIYDILLTMRLQEYVANLLNIRYGNFTHFIGSLHAYRKDYEDKGVF
jgi:thymidylate synthase